MAPATSNQQPAAAAAGTGLEPREAEADRKGLDIGAQLLDILVAWQAELEILQLLALLSLLARLSRAAKKPVFSNNWSKRPSWTTRSPQEH